MVNECCFCGERVLSLIGQDDVLDSFYFQEKAEDEAAVEQGIYGNCHISCLSVSRWRGFWSQRRLDNFLHVRRFERVFSGNGGQILKQLHGEQFAILQANGCLLLASEKQLKAGLSSDLRSLCLLEPERHWDFQNDAEADAVRRLMSRQGKMELLELARAFDVEHRLVDPFSASQSELNSIAGKTVDGFAQGMLIARLSSVVSLPHDLSAFLHGAVNRRI